MSIKGLVLVGEIEFKTLYALICRAQRANRFGSFYVLVNQVRRKFGVELAARVAKAALDAGREVKR